MCRLMKPKQGSWTWLWKITRCCTHERERTLAWWVTLLVIDCRFHSSSAVEMLHAVRQLSLGETNAASTFPTLLHCGSEMFLFLTQVTVSWSLQLFCSLQLSPDNWLNVEVLLLPTGDDRFFTGGSGQRHRTMVWSPVFYFSMICLKKVAASNSWCFALNGTQSWVWRLISKLKYQFI